MPLKRTITWDHQEFDQFLRTTARRPFAWGTNDCCIFPANAIQTFTGVDIASDFRGKYGDMEAALALIKSVTGGSTVEDAAAWCAAKHGLVEWMRGGKPSPLFAQRGDLVVIQDSGNLIAGVIHLNGRHAVSTGPAGLKLLSIRSVVRAWKV